MNYSPLVLAYMGDVVYELYIRKFLIQKGICKTQELQKKSLDYVSAKSQRKHLERLLDNEFLNDEEKEILKWGRNAKGAKTKHADIVTYRLATGLETLIGHLYFSDNMKRIEEIMDFIVGENNEGIW